MDLLNIALALAAGVLSILSPCVLPLVPIVLGTAVAEHRFGPVALATGLAISFTAIGLFVATIGYSVGLDGEVFRRAGAVLLIAIGMVLVMPRWQARVALAAGPVSAWTEQQFDRASNGRPGAAIRRRRDARRRVEPMCRPDFGDRIGAGGARPRSWTGGADDADVRIGQRAPAFAAWPALA